MNEPQNTEFTIVRTKRIAQGENLGFNTTIQILRKDTNFDFTEYRFLETQNGNDVYVHEDDYEAYKGITT